MEHLPFRTVLFSPFDMNLLYFAPSHRRESIDSILKRSFAQFTTVKREYDEVLRQRNALLKQIRDGLQPQKNLDFWDTKLASIGAQYLEYRFRWTDYIEHHTEEIRMALPNHELHFHYMTKSSRSDTETSLRNVIQEHRERDIIV